jgi:anti-sigma factor (TIGR02949 family)
VKSTHGGFAPDCEAVVRVLGDYLDRALEETDMAAIDAHLAACERCHAHAVFERHLLDEIRTLRAHCADADALRARVVDLLRRAASADQER